MADELRVFKLRVDGEIEVWSSDLPEETDPVDWADEQLGEQFSFTGTLTLVDDE